MTVPVIHLDPGLLIDGELELIPPGVDWLDAFLSAECHPLTLRDMPPDRPIAREEYLEFIHDFPGGFHPGDEEPRRSASYYFWMKDRAAAEYPIVGTIGLRLGRGEDIESVIGHIGYHVYPFARGHHYAERACRLLLPFARRQGLDPIWITCNPDNFPSRRTCERLGAELVDIVNVPSTHPLYSRGERQKCRYRV